MERRSWDRGGMGARLWEVSDVVKVKVEVSAGMGGYLRRRTVGAAKAWLGGSGARHRFMG